MRKLKSYFLTMFIFSVSMLSAQWEELNLPNGRSEISSVSISENIYFIGGALSGIDRYGFMDILNVPTMTWSSIELPNPTKAQTCLAIEDKLYIGIWSQKIIDIYDTENSSWSQIDTPLRVGELVQLDSLLIVSNSGDVALYNLNTEEWNFIDGPWRSGNAIAATQGKIVLAGGGGTADVRIYDIESDSWSTAELSIARNDLLGIGVNNKVYFIGGEADGFDWVNRIDIYDVDTDSWSIDSLSTDRLRFHVTKFQNKLIVAGGQRITFSGQFRKEIDILDLKTNEWETIEMPTGRRHPSVVGHDNSIYIAGGDNNQNNLTLIEKYEFEPSNVASQFSKAEMNIYPNPATDRIRVAYNGRSKFFDVFNVNGEYLIKGVSIDANNEINVSSLPSGLYYIQDINKSSTLAFFKI